MDQQKAKQLRRLRRRRHVRRKITGTAERPRLSVFRSSKHIYAQLIDDTRGVTLASASTLSKEIRSTTPYGGNIRAARIVGEAIAKAALAKGITKAAFDRGHYKFHGRVKALADAAVEAGLKFRDENRKPKKVKVKAAPEAAKAAKEPKSDKQGKAKPAKV